MAERFQPIFTLPENLYLEGSPVRIASGALLRDSMTGQIFAQLTMQNIGSAPVKGAKVVIRSLDIAGRSLGLPAIFPYLDFVAERGAFFGQQVMIPLQDYTTRAFSVVLTEVVYADSTIWAAPAGGEWTPLEPQKPLAEALGDPEIVKQYQLRFGADAAFRPDRCADLWRCACGGVNREGETACYACGKQAEALFAPELLQELGKEKDARLEAERIEREAREEEARKKAEADKVAAEARAKKTKKTLKIAIPALVAVIAAVLIVTKVVIPTSNYNKAVALLEDGKYDEAYDMFADLGSFKDSAEKKIDAIDQKAQACLAEGDLIQAAQIYYDNRELSDPDFLDKSFALRNEAARSSVMCASELHTVAVYAGGTVVAVGHNEFGQCDVGKWTDITAVAAGTWHTVGLKSDGTVVATGRNVDGQCDVSAWKDMVAIAAGSYHTVGLKSDGTVVAVGDNEYGRCDVDKWTDIIAIAAGPYHTVGLKSDGTVVAAGMNEDGQCNVSGWEDIVAIAAGYRHTVGVRRDGTVVTVGKSNDGQRETNGWTDIVAVSCNGLHTVGLRVDGTVVATGYNKYNQCNLDEWSDIVYIATGFYNTYGVQSDGSVITAGSNLHDHLDAGFWKNIRMPGRP